MPSRKYASTKVCRRLTAFRVLVILLFIRFPDKEKWEDLFESYSSELNLDVISRVPDEEALRGALSAVIWPLISIAGSRDFSANWKFPLT